VGRKGERVRVRFFTFTVVFTGPESLGSCWLSLKTNNNKTEKQNKIDSRR